MKDNHQKASFIKSGLRIVGYLGLLSMHPNGFFTLAVFLLVLAEGVGIVEEIV